MASKKKKKKKKKKRKSNLRFISQNKTKYCPELSSFSLKTTQRFFCGFVLHFVPFPPNMHSLRRLPLQRVLASSLHPPLSSSLPPLSSSPLFSIPHRGSPFSRSFFSKKGPGKGEDLTDNEFDRNQQRLNNEFRKMSVCFRCYSSSCCCSCCWEYEWFLFPFPYLFSFLFFFFSFLFFFSFFLFFFSFFFEFIGGRVQRKGCLGGLIYF